MYHRSSLAACSGGNITSLSEGTSWSTTVVAMRVRVAGGVIAHWEVAADVHPPFELCKLLVESVCLHVVFDALQGFVFLFDFGHNGPSVDFELGVVLVVMTVLLHLCEGGGVFEATCHFSQSVVGPSSSLKELDEPQWQGAGRSL